MSAPKAKIRVALLGLYTPQTDLAEARRQVTVWCEHVREGEACEVEALAELGWADLMLGKARGELAEACSKVAEVRNTGGRRHKIDVRRELVERLRARFARVERESVEAKVVPCHDSKEGNDEADAQAQLQRQEAKASC